MSICSREGVANFLRGPHQFFEKKIAYIQQILQPETDNGDSLCIKVAKKILGYVALVFSLLVYYVIAKPLTVIAWCIAPVNPQHSSE